MKIHILFHQYFSMKIHILFHQYFIYKNIINLFILLEHNQKKSSSRMNIETLVEISKYQQQQGK